MKATRKMLTEVKRCCHHGHGASLFRDGTVMQAISYNDIIARSMTTRDGNQWDYRLAYIDDPAITLAELQGILDTADSNG